MTTLKEVEQLLADKANYILNHSGAGKDAMDVISKAYKEGKVFDDLLDYIKFISFFCYVLGSGDREKYINCSNSLYTLEQINVWLMMKLVNNK